LTRNLGILALLNSIRSERDRSAVGWARGEDDLDLASSSILAKARATTGQLCILEPKHAVGHVKARRNGTERSRPVATQRLIVLALDVVHPTTVDGKLSVGEVELGRSLAVGPVAGSRADEAAEAALVGAALPGDGRSDGEDDSGCRVQGRVVNGADATRGLGPRGSHAAVLPRRTEVALVPRSTTATIAVVVVVVVAVLTAVAILVAFPVATLVVTVAVIPRTPVAIPTPRIPVIIVSRMSMTTMMTIIIIIIIVTVSRMSMAVVTTIIIIIIVPWVLVLARAGAVGYLGVGSLAKLGGLCNWVRHWPRRTGGDRDEKS
jgi:hypothetical protein